MNVIRRALSRISAPLTARRAERRMDEEFRLHIELETEKNVRSGMPPAEARRRAHLTFGGVDGHREAMRDGRSYRWLPDAAADVRYALRGLRRNPGFALVAALTLALGIGANTAIYSVVDGVLLEPLPLQDPGRLVALTALSYKGEVHALQQRARTMDLEAAGVNLEVSLTEEGEPARLEAATVSGGMFALLGLQPMHGRGIRSGDAVPGAEPVVVLGHSLWQQRFGGAPSVVGRQIRLDGVPHTVVGVLPVTAAFPSPDVRLWLPMVIDPADQIGLWSTSAGTLVGRLREGVTLEQAQREISGLAPGMRDLFPWNMPADYGATAAVVPLREFLVGDVRASLLMLLAAVGLILLIACVNVANLLLARSVARRHETTVRTALGAGRSRLIRQHLAESAVLGTVGAIAGVAIAWVALPWLLHFMPLETPRLHEIGIDSRVLLFAVLTTTIAILLFGLVPALRTSDVLHATLSEGGRAGIGGGGRRRISAALIIAQAAFAVLLVTGSLLVMKGFWRLNSQDPGFAAAGLVTTTMAPPEDRYAGAEQRRQLIENLLATIRRIDIVDGAAAARAVPFGGRAYGSVFMIEGRPSPATSGGDWPWADVRSSVSPGYFELLGVPVREGRAIGSGDRAGSVPVAVISRSLADLYWPDGDALGARISFPGDTVRREIVGIAEDVHWERLTEKASALYLSLDQMPGNGPVSIVVRTEATSAMAGVLRQAATSADDAMPVSEVATLEELIGRSLQQPRLSTVLLALFSVLALVLGGVGIYGVIAFTVTQRTREFGVRLALGARPVGIARQVAFEAARLIAGGIVLGLLGAAALTRFMSSQLHGVNALDPVSFLAAPTLLAVIALVASWLPARRAARTDPIDALRGA